MKDIDHNSHKQLSRQVQRQIQRKKKAAFYQPTLLGQSVYLGSLGLVFVLPLIAGAYLGLWLDNMMDGYSLRWTLSLIVIGLVIGVMNVYLLIKEYDHE